MKRFILPLMFVLCLVGCGSLHADYVAADRANYDAIAPVVSAYIHGDTVPPTSDRKDFLESKLVLWNARIAAAEEALAAEEQK